MRPLRVNGAYALKGQYFSLPLSQKSTLELASFSLSHLPSEASRWAGVLVFVSKEGQAKGNLSGRRLCDRLRGCVNKKKIYTVKFQKKKKKNKNLEQQAHNRKWDYSNTLPQFPTEGGVLEGVYYASSLFLPGAGGGVTAQRLGTFTSTLIKVILAI